jgi:hypothetical protein
MAMLSTEKARAVLRDYPFKKGRSELKKALAALFPQDEPCVITTVDGLRLALPDYRRNTRIFWWFEEIEPSLQFYIRRFVPAGGHVIDVGANSGIIGLLAARLKSAQVKLIEIDGPLLRTLAETLALNPEAAALSEVIARPCATAATAARFPELRGITLEEVIDQARWPRVDLLKIDVDGTDFDALASAGRYLRPDFLEAIYIETETSRPDDIRRTIDLGYAAYAAQRTFLPDLKRLGVNQTERYHFQALDLGALAGDNVPSNTLFLARTSAVNEHFARWCR